ncbi:MAG: hypothetical protein SFZ03_09555 [Candidatus Melainabacteria bacterium]|nr:hypothetical protein [Candidatus Melainabacteria bacterium]
MALFSNGVEQFHFFQGVLSSCQFLSGLYAVSRHPAGAALLESMVVYRIDGVYEVTFPPYPDHPVLIEPKALNPNVWVTNSALIQQLQGLYQQLLQLPGERYIRWMPVEKAPHVEGDRTARLFEMAYAKLMKQRFPEKYKHIPDDQPLDIYRAFGVYHYHPATALRDLTGWTVEVFIANGGTVFEQSGSFADEAKGKHRPVDKLKKMLAAFAESQGSQVMVASSIGQPVGMPYWLDPGQKINPWHDHAVMSVDTVRQRVTLVDPINTRIELGLTYEDFFRYFNGVSVAYGPE